MSLTGRGSLCYAQGMHVAVALSGGTPISMPSGLAGLPSTLISHGVTVRAASVSRVRRLTDALSASGSRYDVTI